MKEARPGSVPGEPLLIFASFASGPLFRENDTYYPSGFYMLEHFREPEFMGLDNDDWLF